MKELALYLLSALGFLFLLGYSIHMMLDGFVTDTTELIIILISEIIGIIVLAILARNIYRARRD